jgi:hypothetical protein
MWFVDGSGSLKPSFVGGLELGGKNITHVTNLTEVNEISNTTQSITVQPPSTFKLLVGTVTTAARELLGSDTLETVENILNPVTDILGGATKSVIQGLGSGVTEMLSSAGFDVTVGNSGAIRKLFGFGDVEADDGLLTGALDIGSSDSSSINRLGTGNVQAVPTSAYNFRSGDGGSNLRGINSGIHLLATNDLDVDDDVKAGTGDFYSTTTNLTLYPDTASYDIYGGTGSFLVNFVASDDITNIDTTDLRWASFKSSQGGTTVGIVQGASSLLDIYTSGTGTDIKIRSLSTGGWTYVWSSLGAVELSPGTSQVIRCTAKGNPTSGNSYDWGDSTLYWKDMYASVYYGKTGTIQSFDEHDDMALLKQMEPDPNNPGFINPDTVPEIIAPRKRVEDPETGEIEEWSEGFYSSGAYTSLIMGGLKQFHTEYEEFRDEALNEIEQLKEEIKFLRDKYESG